MRPDAEQSAVLPTETRAGAPVISAAAGGRRLFWWISIGIIVSDQLTKMWIDAVLPVYGSRTIIPGLLDFIHIHNAGVAFGWLNDLDHPQRTLITVGLALAALAGIAYYARQVQPSETLARLGLSLILGGAIGNLIDRARFGYVVDFVDVYWGQWHFWAFNLADAAISIGAVLVFIEILFLNRHASDSV